MADDFDRIKRNLQKMLDQSAPESDLDEYLRSERLTPDEFRAVATGKMSYGSLRLTQKSEGEIAKSLSRGQTMPAEGVTRASILPFSKAEKTGETYFDPDAGIFGVVKRAAMLPGDVMEAGLDPTSPEGIRRINEFGFTFSPASPVARATETPIKGTARSLSVGSAKTPSADELKAAASQGFKQARSMGVDYSADAVKGLGDDITRTLESDGMFAELAPKTFAMLGKLKDPPEGAVSSLDNLVTLRRALQKAAGDFTNPTERAAATRAIDAVDDFVMAALPESVVAGPASEVAGVVGPARANYAAAMRSDTITNALKQAELDAAAANSGLNIDNRTRQVLNAILKSDKRSRGFSKEELDVLEQVVRGKFGTNLARYFGNLMGGGGGLGSMVSGGIGAGIGAAIGGTPGAIIGAGTPAAMGTSLRSLAGRMTRGAAESLDDLIRQRSPLYLKAQESPALLQNLRPEIRQIIERSIILQQLGANGIMQQQPPRGPMQPPDL